MSNTRQESRESWNGDRSFNSINTGSLQRIADSLERIEKPYLDLIRKVEYLDKRNKELTEQIRGLEKTNSTLRGWITRLKNKLSGHE